MFALLQKGWHRHTGVVLVMGIIVFVNVLKREVPWNVLGCPKHWSLHCYTCHDSHPPMTLNLQSHRVVESVVVVFFFFFFNSMNFVIFIVVQLSLQPNFTAFLSQTPNPSLPCPQPVSFGNHTFFIICDSVSVMQSSLYPVFFRVHI